MKPKLAVLAVGSFLVLASCDAFFSTNLFKEAGLGQVKLPSASELASMSTDELLSEADSPEFYVQLEADSDKLAAVLANLNNQVVSSSDPATVQEAAFLSAQIQLKTTDAFEAVNGIFDAFATVDLAAVDETNIDDLLRAALPAGVLEDRSRFDAAIAALLAADAAYTALGTSIGPDGVYEGDIPVGDLGTAAQGALVAAALAGVTANPDLATALWAAIDAGDSSGLSGFASPSTSLGTSLGNLLGAAGITFTFN